MREFCAKLDEVIIDSGHWAQERPTEVNQALVRWLTTRALLPSSAQTPLNQRRLALVRESHRMPRNGSTTITRPAGTILGAAIQSPDLMSAPELEDSTFPWRATATVRSPALARSSSFVRCSLACLFTMSLVAVVMGLWVARIDDWKGCCLH